MNAPLQTATPAPAGHPGVGALPHADGAAFRVWAPNAQAVYVKGEFNRWNDTALQDEWFRDDVPLDWDNSTTYRSIIRLYRDLIALRLNRNGASRGRCGQFINIFHLNERDKLLAYQRWDRHGPGDDVVVLINFGCRAWDRYEIGMPAAGRWKLRFNSDAATCSEDFGDHPGLDVDAGPEPMDGLAVRAAVSIGPYSGLIYCLAPEPTDAAA